MPSPQDDFDYAGALGKAIADQAITSKADDSEQKFIDSLRTQAKPKDDSWDVTKSLKATLYDIPSTAAGIADLPIAAATSLARGLTDVVAPHAADWLDQPWASIATEAIGDAINWHPDQTAEQLRASRSPEYFRVAEEKQQEWDEGRYGDYLATIAMNPIDTVGNLIAEALPLTVASGVAGRGIAALSKFAPAAVAPTVAKYAFAAGEGTVAAGAIMSGLTEQGLAPSEAAPYAVGAGLTTGVLGALGKTVAQKAGLEDLEAAIAGAPRTAAVREGVAGTVADLATKPGLPGYATRIGGGMLTEGAEEALQSPTEQMWQNAATGQDLFQGAAQQMVEGALAGAGMGGAFNAPNRYQAPPAPPPAPEVQPEVGSLETLSDKDLAAAYNPKDTSEAGKARLAAVRAEQQARAEFDKAAGYAPPVDLTGKGAPMPGSAPDAAAVPDMSGTGRPFSFWDFEDVGSLNRFKGMWDTAVQNKLVDQLRTAIADGAAAGKSRKQVVEDLAASGVKVTEAALTGVSVGTGTAWRNRVVKSFGKDKATPEQIAAVDDLVARATVQDPSAVSAAQKINALLKTKDTAGIAAVLQPVVAAPAAAPPAPPVESAPQAPAQPAAAPPAPPVAAAPPVPPALDTLEGLFAYADSGKSLFAKPFIAALMPLAKQTGVVRADAQTIGETGMKPKQILAALREKAAAPTPTPEVQHGQSTPVPPDVQGQGEVQIQGQADANAAPQPRQDAPNAVPKGGLRQEGRVLDTPAPAQSALPPTEITNEVSTPAPGQTPAPPPPAAPPVAVDGAAVGTETGRVVGRTPTDVATTDAGGAQGAVVAPDLSAVPEVATKAIQSALGDKKLVDSVRRMAKPGMEDRTLSWALAQAIVRNVGVDTARALRMVQDDPNLSAEVEFIAENPKTELVRINEMAKSLRLQDLTRSGRKGSKNDFTSFGTFFNRVRDIGDQLRQNPQVQAANEASKAAEPQRVEAALSDMSAAERMAAEVAPETGDADTIAAAQLEIPADTGDINANSASGERRAAPGKRDILDQFWDKMSKNDPDPIPLSEIPEEVQRNLRDALRHRPRAGGGDTTGNEGNADLEGEVSDVAAETKGKRGEDEPWYVAHTNNMLQRAYNEATQHVRDLRSGKVSPRQAMVKQYDAAERRRQEEARLVEQNRARGERRAKIAAGLWNRVRKGVPAAPEFTTLTEGEVDALLTAAVFYEDGDNIEVVSRLVRVSKRVEERIRNAQSTQQPELGGRTLEDHSGATGGGDGQLLENTTGRVESDGEGTGRLYSSGALPAQTTPEAPPVAEGPGAEGVAPAQPRIGEVIETEASAAEVAAEAERSWDAEGSLWAKRAGKTDKRYMWGDAPQAIKDEWLAQTAPGLRKYRVHLNTAPIDEAVAAIQEKIDVLEAELRDWNSREYKKNRTVVRAGPEEVETTIGAANERRRAEKVASLTKQRDRYKRQASILAKLKRTGVYPGTLAGLRHDVGEDVAQKLTTPPEQNPTARGASREEADAALKLIGGAASNVEIVDGPSPKDSTGLNATGQRRLVRGTTKRQGNQRTIYLYLANIKPGEVLATLMHELVHLNYEHLLPFVSQIRKLADSKLDTFEARLARRALERVGQARVRDDATDEEVVAYFVDEAVRAGVDPRGAAPKSLLGRIWAAVRSLLRQLGIYNTSNFTAQELVDLTHALAIQSRFGRVEEAPTQESRDALSTNLPPVGQMATSFWEHTQNQSKGAWINHGLKLFTLSQMAEKFGTPAFLKVKGVLDAISTFANKRVAVIAGLEAPWAKLPQATQRTLSRVMSESRVFQFNPAGKDAPKNADEQRILDLYKTALTDEARQVYQDVHAFWQHDLKLRLRVLRKFRDDVKAELEANSRLPAGAKNVAGTEELLKSLNDTLASAPKVYFPFKRYGDYHVVAMSAKYKSLLDRAAIDEPTDPNRLTVAERNELKSLSQDPNHYIVKGFNWAYQAAAERKRLAALPAFAGDNQEQRVYFNHNAVFPEVQAMSGISAVGRFREKLEAAELDPKAISDAVMNFQQTMFELLPEGHILKSGLKAKLTPGAEEDMRAVFARTARSSAHALARLFYTQELTTAMGELRKSGDHGNKEGKALYNAMVTRASALMQSGDSPFARIAHKVSAFALLGASPAFMVVNLHQPWVVALPRIAAEYAAQMNLSGPQAFKQVGAALVQAFKETKSGITWSTTAGRGGLLTGDSEGRVEFDHAKMGHLTPKEQRYLRHLDKIGQLGSTMEMNLSAESDTGFGRLRNITQTLNAPVQAGEIMNRSATGLVAFRLGMTMFKGDVAKATAFADKMVDRTQINYAASNAPQFMMGGGVISKPMAHLIFQFWKYRQGMLFNTFDAIQKAYFASDISEEEKRAARLAWKGLFATTILTAGVFEAPLISGGLGAASLLAGLGVLPAVGGLGVAGLARAKGVSPGKAVAAGVGTGAALLALGAGGGGDDEPIDFERDIRNYLADAIGADNAELVSKGIWSLVGLDMSKRVGMGDLANPVSFAKFTGTSGKDDAAAGALAFFGAPGSVAASWVQGIYELGDGEYRKAFTDLVPLKGIKDLLRAYGLATEGLTTKTGEVVKGPESFSAGDILARGAGFQPLSLTRYYEGNSAVQETFKAVTGARKKAIAAYAQAILAGDDAGDAIERIQQFNASHPEKTLRIDGEDLRKAVKARRKIAAERGVSGVDESKQLRPFLERGRFAEVGG